MRGDRPPKWKCYSVPEGTRNVVLEWRRFTNFDEACASVRGQTCVYVLQGAGPTTLYVGQASDLGRRYSSVRGLVGALMSEAKAVLFVARVDPALIDLVEHQLFFWDSTPHNTRGIYSRPSPHLPLLHRAHGDHDVPLFCPPGTMRDGETGAFK